MRIHSLRIHSVFKPKERCIEYYISGFHPLKTRSDIFAGLWSTTKKLVT